jgi:hypothetical protein
MVLDLGASGACETIEQTAAAERVEFRACEVTDSRDAALILARTDDLHRAMRASSTLR